MAVNLQKMKAFDKAISFYVKAIEIDSYNKLPYAQLRHIPLAKENLDILINCYLNVLKQQNNFPVVWNNLGDLLTQKGDIEQAMTCYQKACYYKNILLLPELQDLYLNTKKAKYPDFIIVGAGKCGTTSLYKYICKHPQVLEASTKEINFFNLNFGQGLDWYLSHFLTTEHKTGEASPRYFNNIKVIERISHFLPKVKIIILLRNPVTRSISLYYHQVRAGQEKRTLEEVIQSKIDLVNKIKNDNKLSEASNFVDSIYVSSIRKWRNNFSDSQILILKTEDLEANHDKTMTKTFDFLGLNNYPQSAIDDYQKENVAQYPKISQSIETRLIELYKPFNEMLEAEIGINW
ncbi:MAG: sulfotransferase domain-containing protein [Limnospira sp. PMC 1291.21]|uniref:sulfotransferase domain-containing protein n=1 Tax=unclassified Limnospira TaxID=2642885 RepID=UPI0028E12EC8|nr:MULTISPECIES: sulfotransferase domain-containing protein [unclassified Limnospira]MDT9180185.1 sulfotransferase domain-containing protein [Limnospira sp. PMC 1238.20]MDT9195500.1 sulfotransferase domain-containing protein [Limnospira sp. PMC 1245.20]MDT9205755.1 sulfotransferase domain-containing protein [Limnospira sp. PMC 1243.20]MDT9210918.1 sulfotransferase domain-containing protein [Limnospira sp. PMC 1252.20]MDT9215982.1 sulfotransferase domain-containing protein [Limnospira sp. PMC 1